MASSAPESAPAPGWQVHQVLPVSYITLGVLHRSSPERQKPLVILSSSKDICFRPPNLGTKFYSFTENNYMSVTANASGIPDRVHSELHSYKQTKNILSFTSNKSLIYTTVHDYAQGNSFDLKQPMINKSTCETSATFHPITEEIAFLRSDLRQLYFYENNGTPRHVIRFKYPTKGFANVSSTASHVFVMEDQRWCFHVYEWESGAEVLVVPGADLGIGKEDTVCGFSCAENDLMHIWLQRKIDMSFWDLFLAIKMVY